MFVCYGFTFDLVFCLGLLLVVFVLVAMLSIGGFVVWFLLGCLSIVFCVACL